MSFSDSRNAVASDYYLNYIIFCCTFSVVHGAVDGVLAFTVPYLGTSLGGIGNGLMYITYAVSCVFVADPCVSFFGSKKSVLIGMLLLLLYTLSVCFSIFLSPIKWYLFPIGAICGGFGAGIMWTSQGTYYVKNSLEYSKAAQLELAISCAGGGTNGNGDGNGGSGEEDPSVSVSVSPAEEPVILPDAAIATSKTNTLFASLFAFSYLGFETVIISFASLVYYTNGGSDSSDSDGKVPIWQYVVFGVYGSIAAAAYMMAFLCLRTWKDSINATGIKVNSFRSALRLIVSFMYTHFLHVRDLFLNHQDIKLLMPYEFTFGMVTALFISYILGNAIATDNAMEGYIGVLGSIVTLVAACVSYPINIVTTQYGDLRSKLLIVFIGTSCWTLCVVGVLLLPKSDLSRWAVITPYVILHGVGRGIWENTNKAIIADIVSSLHASSSEAKCSFNYSEVLPTITGSRSTNSSQDSSDEFVVDIDIEVNNPISIAAESVASLVDATEGDHLTSTGSSRLTSGTANSNTGRDTGASSGVHSSFQNSVQNAEYMNSQEKSDVTAAYANVYFFSGLGGAVGFFLFAYVPDITTIIYLNLMSLLVSYICCVVLYIQM